MERSREGQDQSSETSPATSAAAALAARVDDVIARVAAELRPETRETLRAELLELARTHAARTVLETATARYVAKHPKRPGRWSRQPQDRRP